MTESSGVNVKTLTCGATIRKAWLGDIAAIDATNRAFLAENYDRAFYDQLFSLTTTLAFVCYMPKSTKPPCENAQESKGKTTFEPPEIMSDVTDLTKNVLVGYILANCTLDKHKRRIVHVISIAVHEDFRRRGIAKELLDTVETEAKKKFNCVHATLQARSKSNKGALVLYCRQGYNHCGILRNYYKRPVEDAVQMKKEL